MPDGVTAHARAHAQKRFKVRDSSISAGNAVMTYEGSRNKMSKYVVNFSKIHISLIKFN